MNRTVWCKLNELNRYKTAIGAENIVEVEGRAAPFTEYIGDKRSDTYLSRIICNDAGYKNYEKKLCKS